MVDTLYKFQFIALLSFYYCSQVGITTEWTHHCYGDWWNSSHPVITAFGDITVVCVTVDGSSSVWLALSRPVHHTAAKQCMIPSS